MRVDVTLGGERRRLEIGAKDVRLDGSDRALEVKVLHDGDDRVELEIAGERVVIEGWLLGRADAPATVVVNGERFPVVVERDRSGPRRSPVATPPAPAPVGAAPAAGDGVAVVPPMPGKIVEVRVRDGETVAKGTVLLVVEAMKMRNEIPSPADGVVRGLSVAVGASVRARETLLRVVPP